MRQQENGEGEKSSELGNGFYREVSHLEHAGKITESKMKTQHKTSHNTHISHASLLTVHGGRQKPEEYNKTGSYEGVTHSRTKMEAGEGERQREKEETVIQNSSC